MTAADVYEDVRSSLNDQVNSLYTNAVQLRYLNMAIQDLNEKLELNNVSVTNATSAVVLLPSGANFIANPIGLVEIQQVWQRPTGTSVPFVPITKYEFFPHYWESILTTVIPGWSWQEEQIRFLPCNTDTDIKLDFIKARLPFIKEATDPIPLLNAKNFLNFKTAALCAMFIGENEERAAVLQNEADKSFDQILGISTKGRQATPVRRRPFNASLKSRSIW